MCILMKKERVLISQHSDFCALGHIGWATLTAETRILPKTSWMLMSTVIPSKPKAAS